MHSPIAHLEGTFNPYDHMSVNHVIGYFVGINPDNHHDEYYKSFEIPIDQFLTFSLFTIQTMGKNTNGMLYGIWHDKLTDIVYIDPVWFFLNESFSLKTAREENQLAIWDCANECEIRVN